MKRWFVSGAVTVSCVTEVEAETAEEAIEEAEARPVAGLVYRAFDCGMDEAWHIDTDGSPFDLSAEEEP